MHRHDSRARLRLPVAAGARQIFLTSLSSRGSLASLSLSLRRHPTECTCLSTPVNEDGSALVILSVIDVGGVVSRSMTGRHHAMAAVKLAAVLPFRNMAPRACQSGRLPLPFCSQSSVRSNWRGYSTSVRAWTNHQPPRLGHSGASWRGLGQPLRKRYAYLGVRRGLCEGERR